MVLFDIFGLKGSKRSMGRVRTLMATGLLSTALLFSGCAEGGKTDGQGTDKAQNAASSSNSNAKESSESGKNSDSEKSTATAPKIPEVSAVKISTKKLKISHEWPASTKSGDSVDVRARVEGTLRDFTFKEGMRVDAGQVLFTIEDSPYRAKLQAAQANLAQAQADLAYAQSQVNVRNAEAQVASAKVDLNRTQQDVDRYKPLVASGTIAAQMLDNAIAARDVAQANLSAAQATLANTKLSDRAQIDVAKAKVSAAEAEVTQANLNIGYCTITSPITGIIGKVNVYPGNLVGQAGNTTPLVTLSKIDPIYVNFSLSEQEYLRIMEYHNKTKAKGGAVGGVDFTLILSDGTVYPHKGTFGMLDRTMDPTTGTMGVRIVFPNPQGVLREGQYGKLRLESQKAFPTIVVPQRAVMNVQNDVSVYVVGEDNVVQARTIKLGNTEGDSYIVSSGLKEGETVVVDGLQKVAPGATCKVNLINK